jgi:nucleoid-associated protein YgaU
MSSFPPTSVRQPQAFDIVDDPIEVCGVATAFEGQMNARIRDANGAELTLTNVQVGSNGIWANYHALVPLGDVPSTPLGTLEIFDFSPKDGTEINKVTVSIVFGRALIDPYHGFAQHTVVSGDTLSGIARQVYGDANQWPRIFEANRDQIANPNLIFPGQVLRVPQ